MIRPTPKQFPLGALALFVLIFAGTLVAADTLNAAMHQNIKARISAEAGQ